MQDVWNKIKDFYGSFYIPVRFFYVCAITIALFITGYVFPIFFAIGKLFLFIFLLISFIDFLLLFAKSSELIEAERQTPEKLSNGDYNNINLKIKNKYNFKTNILIIDELPVQFQKRDFELKMQMSSEQEKSISYKLRPVRRGEYTFGKIRVFVSSPVGLLTKRFSIGQTQKVPVYPSIIQLQKYEFLAISNRLTEYGIKKIRRISNNNEFEQIKEYIAGDDYRTVNWKATARKGKLMVNQYQDEKSQKVYCIIDMGRNMKMPFEEMSLLDYAINASLVMSNIAIRKHDKAGLITYSTKIHQIVPAENRNTQMRLLLEALYKQKTNFEESDTEILFTTIKHKIKQRSLLLIFTNFEAQVSLKRQLNYYKKLAKSHLVVIIFFKNTELNKLLTHKTQNIEEIYIKTIGEKFAYEKKQIVKELSRHGIHSILTEPEKLTVDTINKYLELKAAGMI